MFEKTLTAGWGDMNQQGVCGDCLTKANSSEPTVVWPEREGCVPSGA